MLYLFAGSPRDGDIRWQLEQLCKQRRVSLDMKEFDYVRDPLQDLASQGLWDSILKDCNAGAFDVAVLSPPCNTFSRARWNFCGRFGPRPLRSSHFPKGFPWLRDHDRELANLGNYFFEQSLQVAAAVCAQGGFFILEHPVPQATFPVPCGTGPKCGTSCGPLEQRAGLCISVSSAQRLPNQHVL